VTTPVLRVRRRRLGPVIVLSPVGELDGHTTDLLIDRATTALRCSRSLVVDLSDVVFMDCHAVGVLITLSRRAHERGGRLQVAALPAHAHRLFTLFDLYGVLGGRRDVAGECRSALTHLAGSHRERPGAPA